MVARQNILNTIMLKNVKLFYGNVRLHLATPEICQTINSLINTRVCITIETLITSIEHGANVPLESQKLK